MKNNTAYTLKNNQRFKRESFFIKKIISFVFVSTVALFTNTLTAAELEKVLFSKLPSSKVQISLKSIAGDLPEPKIFKTQSPARLVFDFPGLKSSLEQTDFIVGLGNVTSLKVVEVSDRTRLVVNLKSASTHAVSREGGQYAIVVSPNESKGTDNVEPKRFEKKPQIANSKKIAKVDFRRTTNAGGKVIVKLTDSNTSVNVFQKDGEVIVDFNGTSVDSSLEKRLDVTDFATTVSSVDTFQNGKDVRMIITPNAEFQQISFQNNDIFTVILDPIIETVEEDESDLVDENGYSGERLSLNFQRLEVRSALSVIADFTGLNIIASDTVDGELTLNLKDVPWDQALDVILETRGLSKRQRGNVIWVAPAQQIAEFERQQLEAAQASAALEPLISEVIKVNYAIAEDLADVILDDVTDEDDGGSGGGSGGNDEDSGRQVIFLQQDGSTVTSDDGEGAASSIIKITPDQRTNSLIVTTTKSNMIAVKALIAELDIPVRQVMIETRVVTASDDFSKELGARLGFSRLTENARGLGSGSNLGNTSFSGNIAGANAAQQSIIDGSDIFGGTTAAPGNLNVDLGANGIGAASPASFAFSLFRAGTGFANIINLELSALEQSGKGKIISSPRLITSNQQTAEIETGETRFVSSTTDDSGDAETTAQDAFLSLSVTPQISPDGNITLDVEVTQDDFTPDDNILRNRIETQVIVENGETIVIGGVYQESEFNSVTKVPVLGDIPYLGQLFRQKTKNKTRNELLIFLTPRIIDGEVSLN